MPSLLRLRGTGRLKAAILRAGENCLRSDHGHAKAQALFEAHKVTVLTDQPLNDLFINKEASSRIAKWATELSSTQ
jgi:hypothetical protein